MGRALLHQTESHWLVASGKRKQRGGVGAGMGTAVKGVGKAMKKAGEAILAF